MVPLATQRKLMEATLAWTNEHKKAGYILEVYMMGAGEPLVICEHPTIEDYYQTIATIPIGGFCDMKVYPLADFDVSMNAYIEAMKQAEKMFPSTPK